MAEPCDRTSILETLRSSEERFRALAQSATDAIISIDERGDVVFWNRAAEKIFGWSEAEMLTRPLTQIVPERLRDAHRMGMERVLSTGESRIIGRTIEVAGLKRTGGEFPLELSLSRWTTQEGRFFTGILRDVTERKRAEERLQAANRRMKGDLRAAAKVQESLLPPKDRALPGLRFAHAFRPSEELGGDIFNLFPMDSGTVGMFMLDVSGHGVPAALLSVTLSRLISDFPESSPLLKPGASRWVRPSDVAEDLNRRFPMHPETRQYFTLLFATLDRASGEFRFVSAGHPGPVYVPKNGRTERRDVPGYPIGLVPEPAYEDEALRLGPGDRVYLYSDGVTDAIDPEGRPFGEERLLAAIERGRATALDSSVDGIVAEVVEFCGAAPPADDVSLLAVEIEARG